MKAEIKAKNIFRTMDTEVLKKHVTEKIEKIAKEQLKKSA